MSYYYAHGKCIITKIAEEVHPFITDATEFYIEIKYVFDIQYVVLFMIQNPEKIIYVYGANRSPSEINNNYFKISELMRIVCPLFDGRFFIERSQRHYEHRFENYNLTHMGDLAPIIPINSNSNYLFRDFSDIGGDNDQHFSTDNNNRFYQLIKLISKKMGFDYNSSMNLESFTNSFVMMNLEGPYNTNCWQSFFYECDVLDLLIFSYVMDSQLKRKADRKRIIGIEAERIFWICKNYSNGLLQLIENSIIHSQTVNGDEYPGLLLMKLSRNIVRIELTDMAQKPEDVDNGYITNIFKENLTRNLQDEKFNELNELRNTDITLSDVFRPKEDSVLQKYLKLPGVVAKHYGLITFEHSVSALGGYFQVQSGRGSKNYYSNAEIIKVASKKATDVVTAESSTSNGSVLTKHFELKNVEAARNHGLPYIFGTHYETLLPIGMFNESDYGKQWRYLSNNIYDEPFCESKNRQVLKCRDILHEISVNPETPFIKQKSLYVSKINKTMEYIIQPENGSFIEIDFSTLDNTNLVFRKYRIEVMVKACIQFFMNKQCNVFFSHMTKPDLFIACQLLIEMYAFKSQSECSFFLCDNTFENFVLLKDDMNSIKDSIYKQCSNGALEIFAYRFLEAATRGVE